jgi:hypothetical protein
VRRRWGSPLQSPGKAIAAAAAEVLLEEVAEAGAAEVELLPVAAGASFRLLPAGGRLEASRVIPARTQGVILFALLGIAEHFVGLVDLLELLLGGLLVRGRVRMILAGQFAEGLFDVVRCRVTRDAEGGVVILELGGHGCGKE